MTKMIRTTVGTLRGAVRRIFEENIQTANMMDVWDAGYEWFDRLISDGSHDVDFAWLEACKHDTRIPSYCRNGESQANDFWNIYNEFVAGWKSARSNYAADQRSRAELDGSHY